ncbi:hypothetical protein SUDANB95_04839 [Actinosynnema sp. ALI-1.44]
MQSSQGSTTARTNKAVSLLVLLAAVLAALIGGTTAAQAQPGSSVTAAAETPAQKLKKCGAIKDLRKRVVCAAESQLGVGESGKGDKHCQKYFRAFGSNLDCDNDQTGPWCAAFTRWVWTKSGVRSVPASFHTAGWRSALKATKTPKPGDVAANGTSHISIVTKVVKSGGRTVVHTIDGNVSDKVMRKSHTLGSRSYFKLPGA